jgi:hypothetical protein
LLPIDLQWKHHLQSVGIETFSEPDDFTHKAAAGRYDPWVQHFTDRRGNNVMMNCSDAQDHEEKEELLELFPLHPDGNLKSKCNSSFQGDKETNNIRWGSGEWLSLKFVP